MFIYILTFGTGAHNEYAFATLSAAKTFYQTQVREKLNRDIKPVPRFPGWIQSSDETQWQLADFTKPGWSHPGYQFRAPDDCHGLLQRPQITRIQLNPSTHSWV